MKTYRQQSYRGSALIEVLAASVVLSIGILSLLATSLQISKYEYSSQQLNRAVLCAQSQLEHIRINPYADILTTNNAGLIDSGLCNSLFTPTAEKLPSTDTDYLPIRVTVSWMNKHNISQNISLTTIITNTLASDSGETIISDPVV